MLLEVDVEHGQSDVRGELHLTVKMHHLLDERGTSCRSIDHPLFEPFHRGEDPPPLFVAVGWLGDKIFKRYLFGFIIVGGAGTEGRECRKRSRVKLNFFGAKQQLHRT